MKEKGISQEAFIQTFENALASAYKKQFDGGAEIAVERNAADLIVPLDKKRYLVCDLPKEQLAETIQKAKPL